MTFSHEVKNAAVRLRAAAQLRCRPCGGKSQLNHAGRHLMRRPQRDVAAPQGNDVGFAFQMRDPGSKRSQDRSRKATLA